LTDDTFLRNFIDPDQFKVFTGPLTFGRTIHRYHGCQDPGDALMPGCQSDIV
jgi:hypothetical protein